MHHGERSWQAQLRIHARFVVPLLFVVALPAAVNATVPLFHQHPPSTMTVAGEFRLLLPDSDVVAGMVIDGASCEGRSGIFEDFHEGVAVTVADVEGKPLARGALGPGRLVSRTQCVFGFDLAAPAGRMKYLLQVGTPPIYYGDFDRTSASHVVVGFEPIGNN